jgi:integrase
MSIRYAHKLAGHEPPTNAESVKATVRGIRRSIGAAKARKTPILAETMRAMAWAAPGCLKGLRDRALLLLGFAGAFRRSELVALDIADLSFCEGGLRVMIRRSKARAPPLPSCQARWPARSRLYVRGLRRQASWTGRCSVRSPGANGWALGGYARNAASGVTPIRCTPKRTQPEKQAHDFVGAKTVRAQQDDLS